MHEIRNCKRIHFKKNTEAKDEGKIIPKQKTKPKAHADGITEPRTRRLRLYICKC